MRHTQLLFRAFSLFLFIKSYKFLATLVALHSTLYTLHSCEKVGYSFGLQPSSVGWSL